MEQDFEQRNYTLLREGKLTKAVAVIITLPKKYKTAFDFLHVAVVDDEFMQHNKKYA